jgi:hypothetical protein
VAFPHHVALKQQLDLISPLPGTPGRPYLVLLGGGGFETIVRERPIDMQEPSWTNLIAEIHASGRQAVIAITGGGSSAIGDLLEIPGGSNSILEAVVPYSQTALEEFLGGSPDQFCSEPTARAMAMAAWMRARKLGPEADPYLFVGVGVTASLASDVPKRGDHRIHVALQTAELTGSYSQTLNKGARIRREEEQLAAKLLIAALADICLPKRDEVSNSFKNSLLSGERVEQARQVSERAWTELLLGTRQLVFDGDSSSLKGVFPGAFNPLHSGHREMMAQASKRLGPVACEISITNVDKPPLDFIEINKRLDGLLSCDPKPAVLLTAAPTFREKVAILPGSTFVVGIDTLVRIADPSYYRDNLSQRDQAIREIADARCRFLVFGRQLGGEFCNLRDVDIPADLRALCDEVPVSEFREDVSSTALRSDVAAD